MSFKKGQKVLLVSYLGHGEIDKIGICKIKTATKATATISEIENGDILFVKKSKIDEMTFKYRKEYKNWMFFKKLSSPQIIAHGESRNVIPYEIKPTKLKELNEFNPNAEFISGGFFSKGDYLTKDKMGRVVKAQIGDIIYGEARENSKEKNQTTKVKLYPLEKRWVKEFRYLDKLEYNL